MTNKPFRILGIAGSLRRGSYNRGLLRAARADAPDGVDIGEFDLVTIVRALVLALVRWARLLRPEWHDRSHCNARWQALQEVSPVHGTQLRQHVPQGTRPTQ